MAVTQAELTAGLGNEDAHKEETFASLAGKSAVSMLRGLLKDASLEDIASIRDERLKKHESDD